MRWLGTPVAVCSAVLVQRRAAFAFLLPGGFEKTADLVFSLFRARIILMGVNGKFSRADV